MRCVRSQALHLARQFVYLKSAFTPDLDDEVSSLFQARRLAAAARPSAARSAPRFHCVEGFALTRPSRGLQAFSEDGKLVLHYATTPAWG
jgi:hypothetical protein